MLGDSEYCSAQELISAESDLLVCPEFADNTWEEDFMAYLGPHTKTPNTESDSDSDMKIKRISLKMKNQLLVSRHSMRLLLVWRMFAPSSNVEGTHQKQPIPTLL